MKKLNKILLILSLVLCLGGGLLLGVGAFAGGIDEAQEIAGARMQHYDQEKTQLDEFSALDVDLAICDMEIRPSDDEHAYLEYHVYAPADHNPIHATITDATLQLSDEDFSLENNLGSTNVQQILTGFLWILPDDEREPSGESSVILYLPAQTLTRCALDLDIGSLTADSLSANSFDCSLAVGSLNLANCTLTDSDIDLDIGEFEGTALTFGGENSISLSTGSMSLYLANAEALQIDADAALGDITTSERYLGSTREDTGEAHFSQIPAVSDGSLDLNADLGSITLA